MELPTRSELEAIITEVIHELDFAHGKPHYASAEYEELLRGEMYRPEEDIALNLRLELVDGCGGLRLIRLRLEPENNRDHNARQLWIKGALKARLRHLINKGGVGKRQ